MTTIWVIPTKPKMQEATEETVSNDIISVMND